jgi:hypothetical protein
MSLIALYHIIHVHQTIGLGKFRLGLVQMLVSADKPANLVRAAKLVKEAASSGAQVIALPVSEVILKLMK